MSADPDSDGLNSMVMMVRYLKNFTDKVSYIYHQRKDGHGISNQFVPEDTDLLIICDSSTSEVNACRCLKEDGVDIVILDHHEKSEDNPFALIVNNQIDSYPNKQLSGGGIVYKLLQVLDDLNDTEYHKDYSDLVGIAIIGDIMNMLEPENRYYVYHSLKNIKNPGIKAILYKSNINFADMNSETIAYKIVPVINGAARLEKIELIIELLLEDDFDKCIELAKQCIKLNEERKKTEAKLFKKVKDRIDLSHNIIILQTTEKDKIDRGYNGLLATKIAERYQKPTLVVKNKNGVCAGSGRGLDGLNFKETLEQTGLCDLLEGHANAFGIEINENKIQELYDKVEISLPKHEEKVIEYDIVIDLDEINLNLLTDISKFNYLSGKGAESTKVLIKGLPICERKIMGKNFDTIKINAEVLDLLKFRVNEFYADELCGGEIIDVVGNLNINRYYNWGTKQNVVSLQMFLDEYKVNE